VQDFIWRLQIGSFIQHVTAALTGYTLRHKHLLRFLMKELDVRGIFIGY
jgi:hypothetical protein